MTRNQHKKQARKRKASAVFQQQAKQDNRFLQSLAKGRVTIGYVGSRAKAKAGKHLIQYNREKQFQGGMILPKAPWVTSPGWVREPTKKQPQDKAVQHNNGTFCPVISRRA